MVGHGGSSAGSYLADPTSPIPSHCASVVVTSTLRANVQCWSPVHLLPLNLLHLLAFHLITPLIKPYFLVVIVVDV